jgi:hypothetical protein
VDAMAIGKTATAVAARDVKKRIAVKRLKRLKSTVIPGEL